MAIAPRHPIEKPWRDFEGSDQLRLAPACPVLPANCFAVHCLIIMCVRTSSYMWNALGKRYTRGPKILLGFLKNVLFIKLGV